MSKKSSAVAHQDRVASVWSREIDVSGDWFSLRPIRQHTYQRITGGSKQWWLYYVLDRFLAGYLPLGRCLSLCCGTGHLERALVQRGAFLHCDAFDIAEGALVRARKLAAREGIDSISYQHCDVNQLVLPTGRYDAVFAHSAIHHIENLEQVFGAVRQGLVPGGWFILNEYVGPTQFQLDDRQVEVINGALKILPRRYRLLAGEGKGPKKDVVQGGVRQSQSHLARPSQSPVIFAKKVLEKARSGHLLEAFYRRGRRWLYRKRDIPLYKNAFRPPTVSEITLYDPSEAIRSAEIVPLIREYFDIVEIKGYGGTILQFLLKDIAQNFDEEDDTDMAFLDLLMQIEDLSIECSDLTDNFAVIIARRPIDASAS